MSEGRGQNIGIDEALDLIDTEASKLSETLLKTSQPDYPAYLKVFYRLSGMRDLRRSFVDLADKLAKDKDLDEDYEPRNRQ